MLVNIFSRIWPNGIKVRVIGSPNNVVLAEVIEQLESDIVFLKGHEHLTMKQLAWLAGELYRMPKRFLVFVIHPVQQIGHPTDARLGNHDFEFWMGIKRSAEDYLTQRFVELHRHGADEGGNLSSAGIADPGASNAAPQVKADWEVGLGCDRPERFPVFMKNGFDCIEDAEQGAPQAAEFSYSLEFVD